MVNDRVRDVSTPIAGQLMPKIQIDIFIVVEEIIVKQANFIQDFAPITTRATRRAEYE